MYARDMWMVVHQVRSARTLEDYQPDGAAMSQELLLWIHLRAMPPMSLLSKSVWNLLGIPFAAGRKDSNAEIM